MRRAHHVTGVAPFSLANVTDVGDMSVNPINLMDGLARIEAGMAAIIAAGAIPLSCGGDHLTTLPVLRAVAKAGPVGMIHFDTHSDSNDTYFGDNPFTHGTPFRSAIEEGLLDPKRVVQIGIRGSVYDPDEHGWAKAQGIRFVYTEEFIRRGAASVMEEARAIVGTGRTYVTFDVDSIDPSMAPATGTHSIVGFTTREALEMLRLLDGVTFIGADVVEVAPPFDLGGMTELVRATMMFELLCVMAALVHRNHQAHRSGAASKPRPPPLARPGPKVGPRGMV